MDCVVKCYGLILFRNISGCSMKGFIAPELGLLSNLQELYVAIFIHLGVFFRVFRFNSFQLLISDSFMGIILLELFQKKLVN